MEQFIHYINTFQMQSGWGIIFASIIVPMMVYFRQLPLILYQRLKAMLTISLTIDETDNMAGSGIFVSLNSWIATNRVQWLTRFFELTNKREIVAGIGFNVFYFKSRLFWAYMERKEAESTYQEIKSIGSYSIYTFKWNKHLLEDFVKESCAPKKEEEYVASIFQENGGEVSGGVYFPPYLRNQKQLVSNKTYNKLLEIFENFQNRESYIQAQKPHKETILLYGPPGTGKTNLSTHLAAKFNMELVLVKPSNVKASALQAQSWTSRFYKRGVVYLIEDIDSNKNFLKKAEGNNTVVVTSDNSKTSALDSSLSDLLNTLDGAIPLDNCIVILSSNYPQKLQEAIYRAGRVDHHILVDYISFKGALSYLEWKTEDKRTEALYNFSERREYPAGVVSNLKFAKTPEQVVSVLEGRDITVTLNSYHKEHL